ncbi:MAG: polysaccharide pyruvyl transferase family protein [Phycisphaerae bacterium]|nr:polysaccharide pyruvyl transferase family protein [Phycisphaerae bacterium]
MTMGDVIRIFIAEWVPLANKGEEAIARGLEDMLGGRRPVELGVMDLTEQVAKRDNITVFPLKWLYRRSGGDEVRSQHMVRLLFLSEVLAYRLGMHGRQANLTAQRREHAPMHDFFRQSDLVLVGHDGLFGPESCGVIFAAHRQGKRVGILGAGIPSPRRLIRFYGPLYRKAVEQADFCYLRERGSYELMKEACRADEKVRLAPDPAFAMNPDPPEQAAALLEKYPWYRRARADGRPVVCVTVCQKSVVYDESFVGLRGEAKARAHSRFVAGLLSGLVQQRNAQIAFLPHSVEKGVGNDVAVAQQVRSVMGGDASGAEIIHEDLTARQLKAIIREADFLVGERTHSVIGSVDVATPFVALTNTKDRRMHGIIGEMSGCADRIIDMDTPDPRESLQRVLSVFDHRSEVKAFLKGKAAQLRSELAEVARNVWGQAGRRQ